MSGGAAHIRQKLFGRTSGVNEALAGCLWRLYIARSMFRLSAIFALCFAVSARAEYDFDAAPHDYWKRPLKDPFTKFIGDVEGGRVKLEGGDELTYLRSVLAALKVPVSSQMLVFSNTSLQLRLISASNPRALYFNEDVYVGYIPGGKMEIVSIDPEAGGIFYIFDIPRDGSAFRAERSARCMNCHAKEETFEVPGLFVKSVVPIATGGNLQAFRQKQSGHSIPFAERFGGWYLTGKHGITEHWGNALGKNSPEGVLQKLPLEPGKLFDAARYPGAGSDILPQLLHEHQVGFVNRVLEATYKTREVLHANGGKLSATDAAMLEEKAKALVRYILFADEAPLPGVEGDSTFKSDFMKVGIALSGVSLRDFDLKTRLFKHRCSYMIHSAIFAGMPRELKQRIYRHLAIALNEAKPDKAYAYLPLAEKRVIRAILKATMKDAPVGWF